MFLACGLGHGAALTPHCGLIHLRAKFSSPLSSSIEKKSKVLLHVAFPL